MDRQSSNGERGKRLEDKIYNEINTRTWNNSKVEQACNKVRDIALKEIETNEYRRSIEKTDTRANGGISEKVGSNPNGISGGRSTNDLHGSKNGFTEQEFVDEIDTSIKKSYNDFKQATGS